VHFLLPKRQIPFSKEEIKWKIIKSDKDIKNLVEIKFYFIARHAILQYSWEIFSGVTKSEGNNSGAKTSSYYEKKKLKHKKSSREARRIKIKIRQVTTAKKPKEILSKEEGEIVEKSLS
jgi:hypothetical protein